MQLFLYTGNYKYNIIVVALMTLIFCFHIVNVMNNKKYCMFQNKEVSPMHLVYCQEGRNRVDPRRILHAHPGLHMAVVP